MQGFRESHTGGIGYDGDTMKTEKQLRQIINDSFKAILLEGIHKGGVLE